MNVYIGIPCYGSVDPEFLSSLSKTKAVLQACGHIVETDIHAGCAVISRARNEIVKRFWDSGFDKLLFIDSDMVWDAIDAVKVIHADFDVCGIPYRQKKEEEQFNVILNGEQNGEWLGANALGTGFMCLSRQCIAMMMESYPETAYDDQNQEFHALFDFQVIDRRYYGEDYLFCKRWKAIGGEIWALPVDIGHIGKKVYRGKVTP